MGIIVMFYIKSIPQSMFNLFHIYLKAGVGNIQSIWVLVRQGQQEILAAASN